MEFVTYEQEGFVGVITINRPKALNALNSQVLEEIEATFDAVDLNTTRALVLTGAGDKSFVAGADIGEMSTLTKAEGTAFGKKGNDVFLKIENFPIPVIGAVNGFALGGGCEISLSCDFRICSTMQSLVSQKLVLVLHLASVVHRDLLVQSAQAWLSDSFTQLEISMQKKLFALVS